MDVLFFLSIFWLYPGLEVSFEHSSVRKNLFQAECFCWYARPPFCEIDQKYNFGKSIGYFDS